jgi:hypothetical protein
MAFEYEGNPAATQAPSDPPDDDGTPPTLELPEDSDGSSVGVFYQALKVLADFVAKAMALLVGLPSYKSDTRCMQIPASMMSTAGTVGWAIASSGAALHEWWVASAGSRQMQVSVPLFHKEGSATVYQKLTKVRVKVKVDAATQMVVSVLRVEGQSGTAAPSETAESANTLSSGTGYQVIEITGLDLGSDGDSYLIVRVQSGQANDELHSVMLTYDNSKFV